MSHPLAARVYRAATPARATRRLRRRLIRTRGRNGPTLHGVRGLVAGERACEIGLDLLLRLPAVLLGELHADAGGALALVALRALRRHPDDASCNRELLVLAHKVEQHE